MYHRSATRWHLRLDAGGQKTIWIDGDEGTGKRLVQYRGETYGTHKWDRLPMGEAPARARRLAVCTPRNPCLYHH